MTGAALWDLDGTLVDSADYHWESWVETLSPEGMSITHERFLETFGQRNDSILPLWLGAGATPERIARIADDKEACYRRLVKEGRLRALPGGAEWVRRLHEEGWRQAIASSAPRLNIEVMLEALGLARYFQAIVAAEDVERGKPDPQVFLLAADLLGVPPSRAIVVEDAAAGIEAARRAGMRSIGVSRNGTPLAADIAVSSLADLPPGAFDDLLAR